MSKSNTTTHEKVIALYPNLISRKRKQLFGRKKKADITLVFEGLLPYLSRPTDFIDFKWGADGRPEEFSIVIKRIK